MIFFQHLPLGMERVKADPAASSGSQEMRLLSTGWRWWAGSIPTVWQTKAHVPFSRASNPAHLFAQGAGTSSWPMALVSQLHPWIPLGSMFSLDLCKGIALKEIHSHLRAYYPSFPTLETHLSSFPYGMLMEWISCCLLKVISNILILDRRKQTVGHNFLGR